jgi:hypothetical protein
MNKEKEQVEEFISETRTFLRDFKMKEILENHSNEFHIERPKKGLFSFLYKGWRTIDELSSLGGIITGSTALCLYRFNGKPLISRSAQDWDIMLSRDNFLKFCGLNNLNNFYYDKDRISIVLKRGIWVGNYGYIDGKPHYIFNHDIDIIAKDKLPEYFQIGKYKIASLESILHEKLNFIEDSLKLHRNISIKHIEDCNSIISKIHAYSK